MLITNFVVVLRSRITVMKIKVTLTLTQLQAHIFSCDSVRRAMFTWRKVWGPCLLTEVMSLVLCQSGFAPLTGSNSFKTPKFCCGDIYCFYVFGIYYGSP